MSLCAQMLSTCGRMYTKQYYEIEPVIVIVWRMIYVFTFIVKLFRTVSLGTMFSDAADVRDDAIERDMYKTLEDSSCTKIFVPLFICMH